MRKQLLILLSKMPVKFQKFVAHKALNHIFTKIAEVEVEGRENLPSKDETVIFVCNHLSNIDGPALNTLLHPYDPTFVAGMKLTDDPFTGLFKKVFKVIDIKPNSPDKAAMKEILSLLKNGNSVVIFPEGTRSRVGSMIEGKRGILLLAKISKVRIIPLAMTGSEKILPIKDKDMTGEKLHHGKILIKVGDGFRLPDKEKDQDKDEYETQAMNLIMGSIAKMLPKSYQGVYAQK